MAMKVISFAKISSMRRLYVMRVSLAKTGLKGSEKVAEFAHSAIIARAPIKQEPGQGKCQVDKTCARQYDRYKWTGLTAGYGRVQFMH
jgi:hypothetical protein